MSIAQAVAVDIQRFSLHDGPGIRTTVFLKGCPLSCAWCHNPEAIQHRPQLSFKPDKCTSCGRCVAACSSGVHSVVDGLHNVDFSRCTLAGTCVAVCPNDALSIVGRSMAIEEIMTVILRDKDYYEHSGGGVTISGGEPMTQFEITRALLHECKAQGLHTTLDTCGHVPTERYQDILGLVDLFLFDYKETDNDMHRKFTGASNALILKNLDVLYSAGARIVLRCPLVQGLNDNDRHLGGIRDLALRYPDLAGIEIMPYHNMGVEKARRIGSAELHVSLNSAGKEESASWLARLHSMGCSSATLG
jgi:pyruvate formate lyase activating enzyme